MQPSPATYHPSYASATARNASIDTLTASLTDGKHHLLLAASGSVAIIKLPLIISSLAASFSSNKIDKQLSTRIILTSNATRFLAGQSPETPTLASLGGLPSVDGIYLDEDEWVDPWQRGRGILHIQLRRWADLLVVAPLSANTLAKVVGGWADNLLTSVVRAWDSAGGVEHGEGLAEGGEGKRQRKKKKKIIIVAPSMNSAMWEHPVTAKQMRVLEEEWGVDGCADGGGGGGWMEVLRPQVKTLACGDTGQGGMCDWQEIVGVIEDRLGLFRRG